MSENYETLLLIELLKNLKTEIAELKVSILQEEQKKELPEYLTLKQAAELKGVTSYPNLMKRPWMQPNCGTGYVKINGTRAFKKKDVLDWLKITDSELEQYAAEKKVDISRHFRNKRNV